MSAGVGGERDAKQAEVKEGTGAGRASGPAGHCRPRPLGSAGQEVTGRTKQRENGVSLYFFKN